MTPTGAVAAAAKIAPVAPPIWFDPHEGLGVWLGSIASVFVALVALGLPFLMRWLDKVSQRRKTAANSITAAHHARHALGVILEWQKELYFIGQNPMNRSERRWAFEFQVAARTLTNSLELDFGDPGLQRLAVAALTWSEMALDLTALPPDEALFQLQYTTAPREAADAELQRELRHFMLELGEPLLPRLKFPFRQEQARHR